MTCMCPPPQYTTDVGLRGRTSGRADDNEEAIQKRFKVLREETFPVVATLEQQGLVRRVQVY